MTPTILVTYATKYGSTQEVAEAIAGTLCQAGGQVEILPARQVSSLDGYNAVELFGGAINPERLHFPLNHMPAGDARDWKAIQAWANTLGTTFHLQPDEIEAGTAVSIGSG